MSNSNSTSSPVQHVESKDFVEEATLEDENRLIVTFSGFVVGSEFNNELQELGYSVSSVYFTNSRIMYTKQ